MAEAVDSLMELADGLVAALDAGDFSTPFHVKWMDDPIADLADRELKEVQVWVIDFVEKNESPRGMPIDEFELWIAVQKKFGSDEESQTECRKLSGLVSEISRFCRNTEITVAGEGARCVKVDRQRARDFKLYHELGLYRADIYTTWQKVSADDD